jgi:hypothetical protein
MTSRARPRLLLAALLLPIAASASAADRPRCSPPPPKDLGSPASFATDLVASLGRALDGTRRVDTTHDQAASGLIPLVGIIQEDFACAARFVSPYEKGKDGSIRTAAKNLARKYEALSRTLDGQLEWLRYVDGPKPDPAKSEALLEKSVQRKDEAAEAAAMAAIEAIGVVVELRDGKPTGRLRLAGAERKRLAAGILEKFGEAVRSGLSTENDFATNAAAAWFQVISNPEYQSADAR